MAGIYGIVSARPIENTLLACLGVGVSQGESLPSIEIETVDNNAVIGSRQLDHYGTFSHVARTPTGRFIFGVVGEAITRSGEALSGKNLEQVFLPDFIKSPASAVATLDGAFLIVLFDRVTETLFLASDRFGNFALHYYSDNERIMFATQMAAIRAALGRTSLDETGLHEFIGLGHTMDGRTQFEGIHRVQAATLLTYHKGAINSTVYYRPAYESRSFSGSEKQSLAKEFANGFLQATSARVASASLRPSTLAAALSGGFDSRLVWACLLNLGLKKETAAFTLGLEDSNDMRLGREIAQRINLIHRPIPFTNAFLNNSVNNWNTTITRTEGGLGIESATTVEAWHLQQHQYRMLLDGNGGAIYRRQFMRSKRRRFTNGQHAATMYGLLKQPLIGSGVLREDVEEAINHRSQQAFESYFENSASVGTLSDQLDHYYTTVLSVNRYALSNNAQLNFLGVHQPLMNNTTYSLVQQLPESMRMSNWVHRQVIRLLAPQLEGFNIDNQGMWAPYRGFRVMRYPPVAYERLLGKFSAKLPFLKSLSGKHPLINLDEILERNRSELERHVLNGLPFLKQICRPAAVQKFLKESSTASPSELQILVQLANLAIWGVSL